MTTPIDISPERVALAIADLDPIYMEAQEDSPAETATLEAMSLLEALRTALTASESQVRHWRGNHADMVSRNALLLQRQDLPADRIPAHAELVRLQELRMDLTAALKALLHNYGSKVAQDAAAAAIAKGDRS